jgi:hypothetical protein
MAAEVRILLISGSTRHGSGNTAALRTVQAVAPDGMACDEDWCRILSQSLVLLLWAGHSGSGSSCHPWLVSQARSAVGWFGSCLRS